MEIAINIILALTIILLIGIIFSVLTDNKKETKRAKNTIIVPYSNVPEKTLIRGKN